MTEVNNNNESTKSEEEEMENRRSRVRVWVTYWAATFLFVGGSVFIALLIWTGKLNEALTLFGTILPVSAAIIAYWFGGRGAEKKQEQQGEPSNKYKK